MGDNNKKTTTKNDVKKTSPSFANDQLGENVGEQYGKTTSGAKCKTK